MYLCFYVSVHLCIYIVTHLHAVYLDWLRAVLGSNSRCAQQSQPSCKGTYVGVQLSHRIDYTRRDTVANGIRVIVRVNVYGKILGKDHDPHQLSI